MLTSNCDKELLNHVLQHEKVHPYPCKSFKLDSIPSTSEYPDKPLEMLASEILEMRTTLPRRIYSFFHPRLPLLPLVFVSICFLPQLPEKFQEISSCNESDVAPLLYSRQQNLKLACIFYSINSTQTGLSGIDLGSLLIKNVTRKIKEEFSGNFQSMAKKKIYLCNFFEFSFLRKIQYFCNFVTFAFISTMVNRSDKSKEISAAFSNRKKIPRNFRFLFRTK
jgi:hypothetical protein